jgi:pimeloyl-ACP methyl ester carboxylesterase
MKAGALTPSVVSLNPARRPKDVSKYTIGFNGSLGRSLLDAEVKETAASEDGNEADFSHVYIGHSMGAWAAAQAAVEAGYAGAPSVLVLVAPAFVPTSSKTLSSPTNMLKVLAAAIRGIFTSLILALWRPLCRPLLAMVRVYRLSALQPHFLPPPKKPKLLAVSARSVRRSVYALPLTLITSSWCVFIPAPMHSFRFPASRSRLVMVSPCSRTR